MLQAAGWATAWVVTGCTTPDPNNPTPTTPTSEVDDPGGVGSPSVFADLVFEPSWLAGGTDRAGRPMGGTEVMWLAGHSERLYAAVGYWRSPPTIAFEGAQILRLDTANGDWQVDHAFPDAGRVGLLFEATFRTDGTGRVLDPPVDLLVASADQALATSDAPIDVHALVNEPDGLRWVASTVDAAPAGVDPNKRYARSAIVHTDTKTGVSGLFVGTAAGAVHRAVLDTEQPAHLRWDPAPDFDPGAGRVLSMAVANRTLFAAATVEEVDGQTVGGLYRRADGPDPQWTLIYRWNLERARASGGMRGLTSIATDTGREVLLGAREEPGVIEQIDPDTGTATVEFDIVEAYTRAWGSLGGGATLAAYNDMPTAIDDATGEQVHLIGLWVNHPNRFEPPNNGSNYLVRRSDASYELAAVYPTPDTVPAGRELRATRTILHSPFPDDDTLFFAGYDAGGAGTKENTAWIYRGTPRRQQR